MSSRFAGRVAIVTGSGTGIGRATAEAFAKEGGIAVVADVNSAAAEQTASEILARGQTAAAMPLDVSDAVQVISMMATVFERLGRIDVLVNNAAIRYVKPLLDHSEQEWRKTIDVNLTACFLTCKAAIPYMLRTGKGKIVNVASTAGVVGRPNRAAYCASKGGLIAFTQAAAADMAGQNIYVNAIVPGSIASGLQAEALANSNSAAAFAEETLVRRWGKPLEVAEAALFLASDASDYINGTTLRVDGGWLAARARNRNE